MKYILSLIAFFLSWTSYAQPAAPDLPVNPAPTVGELNPKLPTIFIAGDSTAAKNNGHPIQGWGVPFADYFDPTKVNVANFARGGRSSRTFITEGLWDHLLTMVKPGDFVLIQFGHNDSGAINAEPPGSKRPLRARGSLPGLGEESEEIDNVLTKQHEVVHTFGWYMRKMIADTKAKGATPIVLSLTVRDIWSKGKIERGNGLYRTWDRLIADAAGVHFLDLTRIIADQYQPLGEEKVKDLYAPDHTHMSPAGADSQAAGVVSGLRGLRGEHFDSFLSAKGLAVPSDTIGYLNLPEPANARLPSLFLIGDSTVRNGRGDGANGQWGWGDYIGEYIDHTELNIVNRAVGGTTGRTFVTAGYWERTLNLLRPGDTLVIQFGTNDGSPVNDLVRARGSLPGIGDETQEIDNMITKRHEVVHTQGWYLKKFITEARAAGVQPILCTMVPHKDWKDGKIVRSTTSAPWTRQVAQQDQVPLIDLNEKVAERYEVLGASAVDLLFADKNTHTTLAGAKLTAQIVADGLLSLPNTSFKAINSSTK